MAIPNTMDSVIAGLFQAGQTVLSYCSTCPRRSQRSLTSTCGRFEQVFSYSAMDTNYLTKRTTTAKKINVNSISNSSQLPSKKFSQIWQMHSQPIIGELRSTSTHKANHKDLDRRVLVKGGQVGEVFCPCKSNTLIEEILFSPRVGEWYLLLWF